MHHFDESHALAAARDRGTAALQGKLTRPASAAELAALP